MMGTDDPTLSAAYARYVGKSLGELNISAGVTPGSKQYRRLVIDVTMRMLADPVPALWDRNRQRIRVVAVDPSLRPYESVSFPAFQVGDLVAEDWKASTFQEQVESLLFLPIKGPQGLEHADSGILLGSVSWEPTPDQLAGIEEEWRMYQAEIRADPNDLTTAASTSYIHIRPHAADSYDTDPTAGAPSPVRKSFWLDRGLVQAIIAPDD